MNDAKDFMKNFYTRSTLGTIECNEEYLKKKFAIDGELKYVGDIYDKVGVIITDYIADYIIAAVHDTRFSTYESLLGPTYFTQYNRCYAVISAIIYTDYKEKHSDAYNAYLNPELTPENYFSDERFYDFCDDVRNRLAYNYYIAGDFMEGNSSVLFQNAAEVVDSKKRSILPLCNFEVHSENGIVPGKEIRLEAEPGVKSGEIAIPYQAYNIIFNGSVTRDNLADFEPKTVKIVKRYDPYDETSPIFFEKEFKIFLLFDGSQNEYYISNNDFQDFFEHTMINFSVLFTNTKDANTFLNIYNETYIIEDADTTSIVKVNAILELYDGLCKFVEILLLALCILCIVFFCINNIKDNKHDIGIMKAMGIKDTNITSMIFVQNCVLGLMIIILANIASFAFAKIGNILLINSLKDLTNTYIHNLIIVQYYPALILFDIIFSFIVIFIASIIPLILLRKFKPIEIIKAKE